jgi:dTDP-4-dehydrorhamnose 3,5-epimerase
MSTTVERSARIEGAYLVRFKKFGDSRGYFYESFRKTWVPDGREMVQGNTSFSRRGVLRGMHFHLKQADLWSVPVGRVRAAMFDFRPSSPTFRQTELVELGPHEPSALYIPKGVAHGFLAVEDSIMTYMVDEYYDGGDEMGIKWDDPEMGIDWQLGDITPVLSDRDAQNPPLSGVAADVRPR